MMHSILTTAQIVVEIIAAVGIVSSSLYYLLCLWGASTFLRVREAGEGARLTRDLPGISILKPLKGIDPEIYESFRSHCLQDYPEYEIIFGVSDANDPAIESVRRLQSEFPDRRIQMMVCPQVLGANVKVSNLAQMITEARYEYLIINDSDIRVEPDYLRRVTAPLADSRVGLVTCLYRGVSGGTLGSRLESLGISTDFCASVLAARQLEGGIRFGLGSTLVIPAGRSGEGLEGLIPSSIILPTITSWEDGLRALGLEVKLSDVVVETYLPAYGLSDFFAHQLRWARGVRDARAGGYLGLIFTFGVFWSLLAVASSAGSLWSWAAVAVVLCLRFTVAFAVGGSILRSRDVLKYAWMIPIRDLIAVVVWIISLGGHTVTWRGDRFQLENGKLTRAGS